MELIAQTWNIALTTIAVVLVFGGVWFTARSIMNAQKRKLIAGCEAFADSITGILHKRGFFTMRNTNIFIAKDLTPPFVGQPKDSVNLFMLQALEDAFKARNVQMYYDNEEITLAFGTNVAKFRDI